MSNVNVHSCHLLFDHFQFILIHGPSISGSYAMVLFIASDFTYITSHICRWAFFLLCLRLVILSVVISPLFFSSVLGTSQPGEFIFQCPIILFMEFSSQGYWSSLPFPSLVDHVLWEMCLLSKALIQLSSDGVGCSLAWGNAALVSEGL